MAKLEFIKTIIFDLGGVYFTRGTILAKQIIKENYNINDFNLINDIFKDKNNSDGSLLRKGLISLDEFEERVVQKLGLDTKEKKHIRYIWFGSYCVHYGMEKLVQELKNRYRLIVFSGNIKERVEYLEEKCGFLKYFDDTVFSFDYQKNKEDVDFYTELLNHIKCDPSEAILIDDEKTSTKLAKSLGFKTILYCYTEKLIDDLKALNVKLP